MKIQSLSKVDFETIFEAFSHAFADYEMQVNRMQLQTMLKRRGFDPKLSFAAFDDDKIVAFTLNGIGHFRGVLTAYDTGTGTLKEFRGQGLATKIFEYSIPFLRKAGTKQYLLEVLQHNTKAVSVYKNIGFEITREFYYSIQKNEDIHNSLKEYDFSYSLKQLDIRNLKSLSTFEDFYPSWQNSVESVFRAMDDFVCFGIFTDQQLVGYCVFDSLSCDITQIGVHKEYRRKGIGSLLLKNILILNNSSHIKVINTDISCDSITRFLKAKNIEIKGKQYEMIKDI